MTRSLRRSFLSYLLILAPVALAAAEVAVRPGAVVRWAGEGIEVCSQDGEEFRPLGGACLYPIELRDTGSVRLKRRTGAGWQEVRARIGDYPYDVQRLTIPDDGQVNLSQANLDRVARENRRIGPLWSLRGERRFRLPLGDPLENLPPGGRFGAKRILNGVPKSPHGGADYAAVTGTPVLSSDIGEVVMAEDLFFSGKSVFVHHGDGLITMYFHLDEILVEKGDEVTRGAVIGTVGATGRVTGPHLHYGIRWRGHRIDPEDLLGDPADLEPVAP